MKRWGWLCAVLAGCSSGDDAAIALSVRIESGVKSTHVKVSAKGGATTKQTMCMAIDGQTFLDVAVKQGSFPREVEFSAEGFSDAACTQATMPAERAAPTTRAFEPGKIVTASLALRPEGAASETVCNDGIDDDGDGQIDCADADCEASPCVSGNRCVEGQTCQGGTCQGGAQVTCDAPPSTCFTNAGLCVVDVGCRYMPNSGGSCDDSNPCTEGDRCSITGECGGTQRVCNTPPVGAQCIKAVGACVADGGCEYATDVNGACNDANFCTVGDACDVNGACVGTPVLCPPKSCGTSTNCDADGGCLYAPFSPGTACDDGGVCNGAASCIPSFSFVPSNVNLSELPTPPSGKVTFNCGTTEIDTEASGAPSITGACPGHPPLGHASIVQGGVPTLVLAFEDLEIAGGATLRFVGERPVIIVSFKDITVLGTVNVHAGAQACAGTGAGDNGGGGDFGWQSGGGGGGFGSVGGEGGTTAGGPVGNGGSASGLTALRGGCPGGRGGNSNKPLAAGGGALQLVARNVISIAGTINAPGQGGRGGGLVQAGNGGGSGGAIVLEASQLVASAGALTANGGGGGQQTTENNGQPGRPDASPARGGIGTGIGAITVGAGGDGATASAVAKPGDDATALNFGGGGGGGVGHVRINVVTGCNIGPPVIISPAATSNRPDAGCP